MTDYYTAEGRSEPRKEEGCQVTASSRVGESLRAARARAGMTREALAYRSGVSWSAIAQIESGRRKEVRPTTLMALAKTLGVSVDFLLGSAPAVTTTILEHRLLPYASDEEFLAGALPLVTGGIDQARAALVVTASARIERLRDALGVEGASQVEFAESSAWYSSPRAALHRYRTFISQKVEAGSPWMHILGEPVWADCSAAEISAWTRYESMINLVFAPAPVVLICPYDTRSVPAAVVTDAHSTHPHVARGTDVTMSSTYREPEDFLLEP
jgi:transcriptional regulator with XRE-family HTH domain